MPNTVAMPIVVLVVGLVVPTLITYVYFDLLSQAAPTLQKSAYLIGKGTQVAVLLFALWIWRSTYTAAITLRDAADPHRGNEGRSLASRGWIVGTVSGVAIGIAIGIAYHFVLLPAGLMDGVRNAAKAKVAGLGIDSPTLLAAIGLFYSLLHSGFEELYWRGFIYRALMERIRMPLAVGLSSLGFMSHHVIVLGKYFGYGNPLTYVASVGVAIGGAVWAVMWSRYRSLVPGWISHAIVDASIFLVGYALLFG